MTYHLIDELLILAVKHHASDLLLRTNDRIRMRVNGMVASLSADHFKIPDRQATVDMIHHLIRGIPSQPDVEQIKSLDFHYTLEDIANFRIHIMRTHNNFGIVARLIPELIPDFESLSLPPVFNAISNNRQGLILMAGAAGSGKSTSMASMLNHIIQHRSVHVVTLEDPVEFRYAYAFKGTVSQRELGTDVDSYEQGILDALRESPDIIVVGELRSRDEIQLALLAAETGHLVIATVHATTALGAIQRCVTSFPQAEQHTICERMSENIRAIIVQKLLPLKQRKGRLIALEILIRTAVIRHFILNPDQWGNITRNMEEGHELYGSQSFDQHMRKLVEDDLIDYEVGLNNASHPEDFALHFGKS